MPFPVAAGGTAIEDYGLKQLPAFVLIKDARILWSGSPRDPGLMGGIYEAFDVKWKHADAAAVVGDETISKLELASFASARTGKPSDELKQRQLEQLAEEMAMRKIIRDALKEKDALPPLAEAKQKQEEMAADFEKRNPDQKFADALKRGGLNEELHADTLQIQMGIEEVTADEVTDEALKDLFEQMPKRFQRVRASHILLKPKGEDDKAATRKKIEDLRQQVLDGADFGKLAREHSACRSGKHSDGDLDWFPRGRMLPKFEQAAFALKEGEVSDVVETQFGFHIIKLTGRQVTLEEAKGQVKEALQQRVGQEWVQKAVQKTGYEINPNL
jgi:parvulin-like peptidyl-prolyl isomerase